MKVSVVDFFSGCGGTSLGFRNAGMSIVAGIDNDPHAAATYRQNFPEAKFFERDIRGMSVAEVKKVLPRSGKILFSGCAPCQPFSKQNRGRGGSDPRRALLTEFERFVVALKPDYVVVENVPGLQKVGMDGPLGRFTVALEAAGYKVECKVLDASHFGVPQRRLRLVLVAALGDAAPMPDPTHGGKRQPLSTVQDWIRDLPEIAAGETHPDDPDHASMSLSELNYQRILATPEGGGRESWEKALLLDCHQGHAGHTDVYGRLAWDRPASAMTTRCLSYSNGRYGHPEQHRAISLREAAILQTFPRDFRFSGTLTSRGRQVGNAVPPLLAQRVAEAILAMPRSRRRRAPSTQRAQVVPA
ncbi:DNA cytosine methyltransferase [Micromonospora tulbaghiae]|uniref:DNA cytosine methyltransferase n=1 Tax=Micromonospora tulbaghiae TaxID=479978 RepID=UPI0034029BD8